MRKINRFDDLPNKIKYTVGGGIRDLDKCRKRFGEMDVYECKTKDEVYTLMTKEGLVPATLVDRNPMQGRAFFVALGIPNRESAKSLVIFDNIEPMNTVFYFAQLTHQELLEVLADEKKVRDLYRNKLKEKKKNESNNKTTN